MYNLAVEGNLIFIGIFSRQGGRNGSITTTAASGLPKGYADLDCVGPGKKSAI